MPPVAICDWCGLRPPKGGLPGLCEDCSKVLNIKQTMHEAHLAIDEHVDDCVLCRVMAHPCDEGSRLVAEAAALDGRLDAEYADVFGWSNPTGWYIINRREDQ
jgi:hypothetical protein